MSIMTALGVFALGVLIGGAAGWLLGSAWGVREASNMIMDAAQKKWGISVTDVRELKEYLTYGDGESE